MKLPSLFLILLLTLVAAVGFWLARDADERRRVLEEAATEGTDFFLEQYAAIHMDSLGEPRYQLRGQRMEQRQADGSRWLETPVLILRYSPGATWTLRAEQGWISPAGDEVKLLGEVHIHRAAEGERGPITITTRDTTLWPGPRQAVTDAPARLQTTYQEAEGLGLFLDLRHEVLELKREARGVYVPH
ncbi:LPS export ABC transporter periplasmic protein LptC [Ectothiorhodospira shaposhnikovii]|uniref:LPS export ABC transporter periplasmic protein LptC n=1 Tax=Ectothiorhodospira shaposhnikovii TaxID=1054 RepID=UPI001EE9226A|nr:LPS export ABC transporter periplasmic protein LptC [Ectothiorhodospira shaposhnikovii]MCG5513406.1 LPS export ABC transporter periplasmic protein LptC [Ectothiorhodospira shaposhnikovii]